MGVDVELRFHCLTLFYLCEWRAMLALALLVNGLKLL
jgi:hypothetical protein